MRKDGVRSFILQHPFAYSMLSGGAVACTTFGVGLLLFKAHGIGWPWWFHGTVIALITGVMAALITYSVCNSWLRDRTRAENQERIIAEIHHHVNNALDIIRGQELLAETERERVVEAEIKRIIWTMTEILPKIREGSAQDIPDFPKHLKSSS